jgi:hypothetical protein
LWSGQAAAFSGVVMSALHSLRPLSRQSRNLRITCGLGIFDRRPRAFNLGLAETRRFS